MGRRMFGTVLVLCVLCAGCAQSPAAPATPVDQTVVLAPGQTLGIAGTAVRLTFVGVVSDSRCPADAMCVWPGEGVVAIQVIDSAGTSQYQLTTSQRGVSAEHGSLVLTLTDLSPYPFLARPIAPADYRASVRVTTK